MRSARHRRRRLHRQRGRRASARRPGTRSSVLDDLSTGLRATPCRAGADVRRGHVRDRPPRCSPTASTAVLHFAAKSLVGESVASPAQVLGATTSAARSRCWRPCARPGSARIVFSSTAAVYGEPERTPIVETDADAADQPLRRVQARRRHSAGRVRPAARARRGQPALLQRGGRLPGRTAGGSASGTTRRPTSSRSPGQSRRGPAGTRSPIFGDDYPTPDGTCVRDYIHVADLADAHLLALEAARPGRAPDLQPGQRRRLLRPRGDRGRAARSPAIDDPGAGRPRGGPATRPCWSPRPPDPVPSWAGGRRATCARWSPTPGSSPRRASSR